MRVREQRQLSPVADEVLALTAVARPILTGTLYALKQDVVAEVGGYETVKLKMLPVCTRRAMAIAGFALNTLFTRLLVEVTGAC